ncbi:MAG TPA: flagellar biosynthetic protein FliQ [Terracidiphilus sp.]|jgi:flagellar biosynthetic protein FliQ|nr:flagellar biosynthetic protein FliQ [Terracidiphilus sp.]
MTPDMVAEILRQLMKEAIILAAPLLIAAALLSFLLSLVQTLTSLQEQSLTSVPRLGAIAVIMLVGMPWFLGRMAAYTKLMMTDFHRFLG